MSAPFLIGAHMSVAGGLHCAIAHAVRHKFNCVQLFTHSPRVWKLPHVDEGAAATFRTARRNAGIACVVVHASYLPNCASPHPALWARSCAVIAHDVRSADALGADYFVMHPGSADTATQAGAGRRVAAALLQLHAAQPWRCTFLLENTAAGGSLLGASFDELHAILRAVRHAAPAARLGICLDTAHAHAAGMDLCSDAGLAGMCAAIAHTVGMDALRLIHCNDTTVTRGARRDLHAHIGQGRIGARGFQLLLAQPQLRTLPWILETPKDTARSDTRNANLLRTWFALSGSFLGSGFRESDFAAKPFCAK